MNIYRKEKEMNNFTHSIPTKVYFGKGQIKHLAELKESGSKVQSENRICS